MTRETRTPTPGDRAEALTRKGAGLLAKIGGAIIFVIAILVCGDIVARNLFNRTVFHSFELSAYLFAVAVSFGMAQTLIERGHIRIDLFYARMPRRVRRGLDVLALISLTALAFFLAERGWQVASRSFDRGLNSSSSLTVPMYLPQGLWMLGLAIFACVAFLITLRHVALLFAGRGAEADRLGSISGEELTDDAPGSDTGPEIGGGRT
jgi:TRAP-type C4-dicarboxylate transport system permease small subunit